MSTFSVCNLRVVRSLNLRCDSHESTTKGVFGRGVEHLGLDLGLVGRPGARHVNASAGVVQSELPHAPGGPSFRGPAEQYKADRSRHAPGVEADLAPCSLAGLLPHEVVDGVAAGLGREVVDEVVVRGRLGLLLDDDLLVVGSEGEDDVLELCGGDGQGA